MAETHGKKLVKAAAITMSSVISAKITGFLREMLISHKIGINELSDAYYAGFQIPDFMYNPLVGGAVSAAMVPFLTGYIERKDEEAGWRAASTFINLILGSMVVVCALGMFFTPVIFPLLYPGMSQKSVEIQQLSIALTRTLFPSVAFIMLAGICTGVLNSYKKFAAAAYGPTIYNVGCAVSILIFGDQNPQSVQKVAYGIVGSAAVYFTFQFLSAIRYFRNYSFSFTFRDTGFRKLLNQAIPSIISSSIVQVNVIISASFVTLFAAGSLAAFRNANTTWQLPYGIFAFSIGTAMLTTISGRLAVGELEEYKSLLMKSLKSVLFLSIPSAVAFIVLREPIIRAIFKWGGKFEEKDVPVVAGILMIFSVAMVTQAIVATMNRAFYAANDTKTPLIIGIGAILMNYGFGYAFYRLTNLGASGMALSYSLISVINSVLLIYLMNRKMKGIHIDRLMSFLFKSLPAALVMGIVLYLTELVPLNLGSKPVQLVYLTFELITGALAYFLIMLLFKSEEALYFRNIVASRLKRRNI